jgi:hypothetical protein
VTRAELTAAGYKCGSWGHRPDGPLRTRTGPAVELWSDGRAVVVLLASVTPKPAGRGWWRFPLVPACLRWWRTIYLHR